MPDSSEERRNYLSYIHLKEFEMVLKDLVTFIDRQITVEDLNVTDSSSIVDEHKKKFVVSTFELTGDLSIEPEGGGRPIALGENDRKFALAFSLDVAISFSASMLGLRDNIAEDYIKDERYDSDMQDATKEIFNLANGGIEKTLRRDLEVSVTCRLLETELMDFNTVPYPEELGSKCDLFAQTVKLETLTSGHVLHWIPEKLGDFFRDILAQTNNAADVAEFVAANGGMKAGSVAKPDSTESSIKRVMVVDDTYLVRQLITQHLREFGYAVSERADGVSAVKRAYLMGESLSLILLDLKLPDMSGFRVLEEIKKNPRTKHIKVILCSSISDKEDVIKGFKLGAIDYIVKPFNREIIVGKVVKAIGRPQ